MQLDAARRTVHSSPWGFESPALRNDLGPVSRVAGGASDIGRYQHLSSHAYAPASVEISVLCKEDVRDAFIDHLLQHAQAVEVVWTVVVLNVDHHDVLYTRLIVDSL